MSMSFAGSSAGLSLVAILLVAIPKTVILGYSVGALIFGIGLVTMFARGDWQKARGLDKLVLFGPLFYAAPLAAFATEHFTLTDAIASIVPKFIPWHHFWALFVGTCFLAAALSLVTGVLTRLAASCLALNFFLFVMLMTVPALIQEPRNRIFWALALRELSFSAGPLALAASLGGPDKKTIWKVLATVARYFIAANVLLYSFEQFLHADHLPGVPLERLTPSYIVGGPIWSYLAAVVYAIAGVMILINKKTRAAATWVGLTVLLIELVVYLPIGIVDRASLDNGLNFVFDTLMYCGTILLFASAMPRESD